jgi:outer membrane protein assembly factor BamB
MNGRSVTGSAAVVTWLLTVLVVGALGMVACGCGEQAATPEPTGASPAAEPATPTERVSFSFTTPANGMAASTESPAFITQGGRLTARLIVDRWYTVPSSDGYEPATIVWAGAPGLAYDEGPSPEAKFDLREGPGKYEAEIVNGHDEYPVAGKYILHVDGAHFNGTLTVLEETTSSTSPAATSPVPAASASPGGQGERLVWKIDTGAAVESTPAVSRGVVYIGNSAGHLYAVDLRSGRQRWAFATGGSMLSALAVADGAVYCRSDDGYLHAVDVQSGREMWKFKVNGAAESSPAVGRGTVYLATPSAADPHGDDLYALDGASGRVVWKATVTWKARDDGAQDVVYYGALNTLHALDARTGERLWKADPGSTPLGTPAVARGLVYIRELDNWPFTRLSAVDVKSGRRQWVSRMFSQETMARFTSPAVGDGAVYIPRGDGTVFALDGQSGRERWNSRKGLAGEATPAVGDGTVFVGGDHGWLHALDADTGRTAWRFETGAGALTSPVISNSMVCVGSDDGCLYVVK